MRAVLLVLICIFTQPITFFKKASSGSGPPTTGLALWLKADSGVTTDAQGVSAWSDQSGHGRNFTRPAGKTGTTLNLVTNVQNGLPVVRESVISTGNVCLTASAFFSGTQQAELMAVIKSSTTGTDYSPFGWNYTSAGNNAEHYTFGGTWYEPWGNTGRPSGGVPTAAYTSFNIVNISAASGTSAYKGRIAGTTYITSTETIAWDAGFALFARTTDCSFTWGGDMGEVLVWDHVLSTADRASAYAYLQSRWAVP